ncbi:hypothetical protein Tco_0970936 [Tanacetum coccineum]
MLDIGNVDGPVSFKSPKIISQTKELEPKVKMPGVKSRRRKIIPVAMSHPQSKIEVQKGGPLSKEATRTKSGHFKKRKKSVMAKDNNPSQALASIPVVVVMHKEDQQAAIIHMYLGGIASTIVYFESASGHDALADSTTEVDLMLKDKSVEAMDLDSPEDDPPLLILNHDFSASIPTKLKELPSKVNEINESVEDLKKYMEKLEIEVLCDLKVLQWKLKEFQSSILVLTPKVVALENIKLDLTGGLVTLPKHVSLINEQLSKLKVLDVLPSLLNKVVEALDRFASAIESISQKASDQSVP